MEQMTFGTTLVAALFSKLGAPIPTAIPQRTLDLAASFEARQQVWLSMLTTMMAMAMAMETNDFEDQGDEGKDDSDGDDGDVRVDCACNLLRIFGTHRVVCLLSIYRDLSLIPFPTRFHVAHCHWAGGENHVEQHEGREDLNPRSEVLLRRSDRGRGEAR